MSKASEDAAVETVEEATAGAAVEGAAKPILVRIRTNPRQVVFVSPASVETVEYLHEDRRLVVCTSGGQRLDVEGPEAPRAYRALMEALGVPEDQREDVSDDPTRPAPFSHGTVKAGPRTAGPPPGLAVRRRVGEAAVR